MMRIVFLDRGTIGPAVNLSKPGFAHEWVSYDRTTPDQVLERLDGADIAISNKVPIRKAQLERLGNLKFIALPATGYDVIDVEACRSLGITVSNVRGYAVKTVPEHTFALILALRRAIVGYRQDVIDGAWQASGQFCFFAHPIHDLAESTLGIIGAGAIGKAVGRIAEAFGMRVLYAARKGATPIDDFYTPFTEVLRQSDVITLHCPLTPETRGLIGLQEIHQMQRRPLLINASRGGLVVEEDVVKALDQGLIAGAGFDCLTSEPPGAGHPFLTILKRPNVIITPHVAWASDEAMQTVWDQVIANINNFHAGTPSNVVT